MCSYFKDTKKLNNWRLKSIADLNAKNQQSNFIIKLNSNSYQLTQLCVKSKVGAFAPVTVDNNIFVR